ncbi:MAG: fumarylacetoacetate hydrolase family protein [Parvibaculum sp.]|uniref:fumarylacetoacetate hydrolase family protein n=1 Tax=Parvibaculum sp. TaxID=2024848 RepID=UPI0025D7351C|nr:fumarylacetoacetate hydrolase family protein [Parvibaculum sp.]MCE9650772.1 fumarylacetoacetate hydrolase family protein [Parvibaculum sp.]
MKIVRFGPPGAEKPGLLDAAGRVRDLSAHLSDITGAALSPESLARLRAIDPATLPLAPEGARLGTPVANIGKVMCIGRNYREHAAELNNDLPTEPLLFMKANSSINGPYDDVLIPRGSVQMDYEAELAVIIGSRAKYVSEADAFSYVAGYAIIDDVSERAFQRDRGGQMTKGKSGDTFAPIGPWLVTADEIADPQNIRILTQVDGETRQNGTTADMVFPVAELISYLSQFFTLYPGDVIATGTPSGVAGGMKPPGWVKPGQVVRITIDGLGEQRSRFVPDA